MRALLAAGLVASVLVPASAAEAKTFVVSGRGWGHGVGMSQYGALGFAAHGWSYARILAHYYRGTTLAQVPSRTIAVLVRERGRVLISSRRPYRLRDAAGRAWTLHPRRLVLTPDLRARIRGKGVRLRPPLVVDPGATALAVDGAAYRGSFRVSRSGGRLRVVNVLPLERYLRGVVAWEMPHRWPAGALAAQAVAARSYATSMLGARGDFDVYADTRDQVYGGVRAETPETNRAVALTARRVLLWQGRVARTYYSSTSGGRTRAVPGIPYLRSVADPYDRLSPHHRWGPLRYTSARLGRLLDTPPPTGVHVARDADGRAASVYVRWRGGGESFEGDDFQAALDLRSTWFTVRAATPPRRATAARARATRRDRRG